MTLLIVLGLALIGIIGAIKFGLSLIKNEIIFIIVGFIGLFLLASIVRFLAVE